MTRCDWSLSLTTARAFRGAVIAKCEGCGNSWSRRPTEAEDGPEAIEVADVLPNHDKDGSLIEPRRAADGGERFAQEVAVDWREEQGVEGILHVGTVLGLDVASISTARGKTSIAYGRTWEYEHGESDVQMAKHWVERYAGRLRALYAADPVAS